MLSVVLGAFGDDGSPMILAGDPLAASLDLPPLGSHLMVVITMEGGTPVGYRSVGVEVSAS